MNDPIAELLAEAGLTDETAAKMREARYLTAERCPRCGAGVGKWCRDLPEGKVHAERGE